MLNGAMQQPFMSVGAYEVNQPCTVCGVVWCTGGSVNRLVSMLNCFVGVLCELQLQLELMASELTEITLS